MLPGLVPLDAVDRGAMHAKIPSDLGHRLTASRQLALNLQHLFLRQRRPTLAAGFTGLTLRLRCLYRRCTDNFFAGGQRDGLLGLGQIQLDALGRKQYNLRLLQRVCDLLELLSRKDVHVH